MRNHLGNPNFLLIRQGTGCTGICRITEYIVSISAILSSYSVYLREISYTEVAGMKSSKPK